MPYSETQIANIGLLAIGESRISSISDTGSKAARLCAAEFAPMRDELLRAHDWNCARAQASLPALATAPLHTWARQFQLPADYLCFHATADDDDDTSGTIEWEVQGRALLTNEAAPLLITYTRQLTDTGLFDAGFATALGYRIGMQLAMPMTGSAQVAAKVRDDYDRAITRARGSSYRERRKGEPVPSWIAVRY